MNFLWKLVDSSQSTVRTKKRNNLRGSSVPIRRKSLWSNVGIDGGEVEMKKGTVGLEF